MSSKTTCLCGCGSRVKEGKRYLHHHHLKGHICSEETKEKIRISNTDKVRSDETKAKLSALRVGIEFSEETRLRLRSSHIGKHHSEETKQKMGDNQRGKPKSFLHKRRIRAAAIKRFNSYPELLSYFKFGKGPTKPQLKMFAIVKSIMREDIEVLLEYVVKTKTCRIIDVAIPSLMLGFEYDGEYWHQDVAKESLRDKELVELGWSIAHINSSGLMHIATKDLCNLV